MSSFPYEIIKGGGHVSLKIALSTEQIYLAQNRAPVYGKMEGRKGRKGNERLRREESKQRKEKASK